MNNSKVKRLVDIWYLITVTVLILLALKYALPLILPFVLAAIVAAIIRKPVNYIADKTRMKREAVSFFAVALVTMLIILLISLLVYSLYSYFGNVLTRLPELLPKLTALTEQINERFNRFSDNMPQIITDALLKMPAELISTLTAWLTDVLTNTAKKLPSFIIATGVTIFASFLITRDYYKLGNFLESIIPKNALEKIKRYRDIAGNKSFGMLKGYAVLTAITYVILLIGLLIIGESYAPAIAAIIAFIDFLPILGTGVVLVPWAVINIFKGEMIKAVGLLIIYAVATVVRNVLSPKILGNQIKLDSLTVLISMYVGYGAFGITGLIVAPFVTAIGRDILME